MKNWKQGGAFLKTISELFKKKEMGRFSGFSSIHSSDGRKGKTQKPENLLIYKAFWVLKSFRLPPRKKQVFLERFWDATIRSFQNFFDDFDGSRQATDLLVAELENNGSALAPSIAPFGP